jgi:hypothetical protein
VSHPRRTHRSRETEKATWLKFNGLSGGAPDCPVSQRRQGQRSSARSTHDTWPAPTGGWVHRTVRCAPDSVRCAIWPRGATVGCARYGRRSRTRLLQWLSGGAPDCPVHHSIEGKDGLPNLSPTAPSCLGAIKGTPRHMEQYTKLTRNILRHLDSAFTQSDHSS